MEVNGITCKVFFLRDSLQDDSSNLPYYTAELLYCTDWLQYPLIVVVAYRLCFSTVIYSSFYPNLWIIILSFSTVLLIYWFIFEIVVIFFMSLLHVNSFRDANYIAMHQYYRWLLQEWIHESGSVPSAPVRMKSLANFRLILESLHKCSGLRDWVWVRRSRRNDWISIERE